MAFKLKFRTLFPASVTAASPLTLVKTGSAYSFGLNENQLRQDIGAPSTADVMAATASAASSAAAAAASASFLAGSLPTYPTRAAAAAAAISTSYTSIQIIRHTAGYPNAPAIYVPGSSSGPMAFQEAGGHYWQLDLTGGVIDPRWFGAKGDGVNDDTTALQAALTQALGGKQLFIPAGTWGISSTLNGGAGSVRVFGAGKSKSIVTVLGSNVVDPVLQFTDASDVIVEDIDFRGNGVTVVIGAMQFLVTAGSNVIGNYTVRGNAFSNFKAQYWIRFLTNVASTSHTRRMRYIRVLNNDWVASTSLAPDFTSIGIPSMMLAFQGSVENNGSYIDDVIVSGNFADASGVKGFFNAWAGVQNCIVQANCVLNAGALGQNDRGCYAMLAYNNQASAVMSYAPTNLKFYDNYLINPRSIGIYGASAGNVEVCRNYITGVQDPTTGSLHYAGVSCNGVYNLKVEGNLLVDNIKGIDISSIVADTTPIFFHVTNNQIRSSVANGLGIVAQCLNSFVTRLSIRGNSVQETGAGCNGITVLSTGAGFEWDTVDVLDNDVSATQIGINVVDGSSGGCRANVIRFRNHVRGSLSSYGIDIDGANAGKTFVFDSTVDLGSAGASCIGALFDNHPNINIDGLKILNRSTGSALAYSASAAVGSLRNVTLVNVARANLPADGAAHLGFVQPTAAGNALSAFIQNLATTFYTPTGTAGSQYTIDGWVYQTGTTWQQKRCLTGT